MKNFRHLIAVVLLLMGCHRASSPSEKDGSSAFEKIQYSRQFGILNRSDSRQVFYIHNKDTQWGERFEKNKPLPRIAVLSTVFAGFIELLNQQQQVVAIDNEKFYSDVVLLKQVKDLKTAVIGEEGQIQIEKLLAQKPDILVCSTFEFNKNVTGERLEKLGVKIVYCDNFKEQHPLARAEWIKFFGVITGQFEKADSLFRLIEKNYNAITERTKRDALKDKPKVMADAMFGDSWFVPGGNSFTAQLVNDAGGDYIFKEKTGLYTYPLTLEDVLKKGKDADIWIHTNQYHTLDALKKADSRYTLFRPYNLKRIYNNDRQENRFGGNDYWEKGVGRPDLILSDLYAIVHEKSDSEKVFNYYTKLK